MKVLLGFVLVFHLLSNTMFAISQGSTTKPIDLSSMFWMSEQYPPYNWKEDNKDLGAGIVFDVVVELMKRVDTKADPKKIDFLPWARSYQDLQNKKNTALFSFSYHEERRKSFKWVGPVVDIQVGIIAKKGRYKSGDREAFKDVEIGVIDSDIGDQLVRKVNYKAKAIKSYSKLPALVQMLDSDRVGGISYETRVAFWTMKEAGLDLSKYEVVDVLESSGSLGIGFHNETDPETLKELQKNLEELRKEGFIAATIKKYVND